MSVRECIVTPEMARDLLDKNTNNRHLSRRRVDTLVKVMQRGEWQYNGDAIRISKSGRLLDGQHRLSAIERSGIAQKYIIVDNLDDESFTTIDIGSARRASQMLGMLGAKNTTAMAAAAKMVLMLSKEGKPIHGSPDKQVTHSEIVDFADSNAELVEAACFATRKWPSRYMGPATSAFCYYVFGKKSESLRDSFFKEMIDGEFSYQDSPVRFVRDVLIEERGSSQKTETIRKIALIFKAFRLYSSGASAKIVRLEKDQLGWFKL